MEPPGALRMDTRILSIFQLEVKRQAKFGLMAASEMEETLRSRDNERFWYSIQALLVAAGNVSKLLWTSGTSKKTGVERGRYLRNSLAVDQDSPLHDRTLRNNFEHFDERLDAWTAAAHLGGFVDSNVGPRGMIRGTTPASYLRNYETDVATLTFKGESLELKPLVQALVEIHEKAAAELGRTC